MNVQEMVQNYLACLERENARLLQDKASLEQDIVSANTKTEQAEKKAYVAESAREEMLDKMRHLESENLTSMRDITKRDTIIWKLGLACLSDKKEDKDLLEKLGKAVGDMQANEPVPDLDVIVETIYAEFDKEKSVV